MFSQLKNNLDIIFSTIYFTPSQKIGDFIPLKTNGSARAIVVTDEERTFFRITIPCHEAAGNIRRLGINIERQDGRKEGKWVIKIGK